MHLGVSNLINIITGVFIMQVQGIYDESTQILTISGKSGIGQKAFKISNVNQLEVGARLERLTNWAREKGLIRNNSVIAEI